MTVMNGSTIQQEQIQAEGTLKLVLQCPHLPIKVHSVQADSSTGQCPLLCHKLKGRNIKKNSLLTDLKLLRLSIYYEITSYTQKKSLQMNIQSFSINLIAQDSTAS
jgi:hypothetical protein